MIDLQERFDRAWSDEPGHVDVEQRLAVGHRTVRRRRLTVAAGGLAAVLALGGTALAVGLDPSPAGTPPAASGPAPVPGQPSEPAGVEDLAVAGTVAELAAIGEEYNAGYADDGRLLVRPGWVVTRVIDEVHVGPEAEAAVGLEVRNTATLEREWYYLRWVTGGSSKVNRSWPQANLGMTLREWLPDREGNRVRPRS